MWFPVFFIAQLLCNLLPYFLLEVQPGSSSLCWHFLCVVVVADLFESGTDVVSYHALISSACIQVVSEATSCRPQEHQDYETHKKFPSFYRRTGSGICPGRLRCLQWQQC